MKLYIQDEEVLLDYSDVNFEDCNDNATSDYYAFMRGCTLCGWERTLKPKIKRLIYSVSNSQTPYGNAAHLRSLLGNCYYTAIYYKTIEISDDFKPYLDGIEKKCEELREIEVAKENARKAAEKWKEKCKYGCGRCSNKRRCGDDFMCAATGEILEDRPIPTNYGRTYYPFNMEAFPTENCPFNVNKKEEAV